MLTQDIFVIDGFRYLAVSLEQLTEKNIDLYSFAFLDAEELPFVVVHFPVRYPP